METDSHASSDLPAAIARADAGREALRAELVGRRARLPLRYWRQQAHFTTPAADEKMARKAVEGGTEATHRMLQRWRIEPRELADRLGTDPSLVDQLLAQPRRAPLVMLDGEDAQALRDDVTEQGLRTAADVLANADWQGDGPATLRFFRPPGFELGATARDLFTLLWTLAEDAPPASFPLDGIVFPKIDHPEEVDLLYSMLSEAEEALGLPNGRIRVSFLVESGWAAAQLSAIAQRAAPRLCALIFGLADYSADLGLPSIANEHPLADWARAQIVAVAGAVGVPAIDGMTLDYPVADASLDEAANRRRFLDRMALVYDDALRARSFGMCGKWVGHPAQLFAVLLAFESAFLPAALEEEAAKLAAYRAAVEEDARGATIIGGVMSDRATDRHARVVLRQAVAMGRFDARRAVELGVVEAADVNGPEEEMGG
jgi:citrate lyase subunit beta/citryl-CoA lyase